MAGEMSGKKRGGAVENKKKKIIKKSVAQRAAWATWPAEKLR